MQKITDKGIILGYLCFSSCWQFNILVYSSKTYYCRKCIFSTQRSRDGSVCSHRSTDCFVGIGCWCSYLPETPNHWSTVRQKSNIATELHRYNSLWRKILIHHTGHSETGVKWYFLVLSEILNILWTLCVVIEINFLEIVFLRFT